jgi:hypothetical protein
MPPIRSNHYGQAGSTVPDDVQQTILDMCREGVGRNEIARRTGVNGQAVSGIVKRAGLSFDAPVKVRAATARRAADLKQRRIELSARLLDEAEAALDAIRKPIHYTEHGGKDFDRVDWDSNEPIPADKLRLMQTAAAAIGRHLNLEQHDAENGAEDAKSMLAQLGAALGVHQLDQ